MKRTILTPAILMAATLFTATITHAQAQGAASDVPPGPGAQASSQGPTGQATAQTNNVNVVNVPTVTVGNAVTIKEPVQQPLYVQRLAQIINGQTYSDFIDVVPPQGKRMVIETIGLSCGSGTPQWAGVSIYGSQFNTAMMTLIPTSMMLGYGSVAGQAVPVHLLVDEPLKVLGIRGTTTGFTECAVTFMGYTTPLQ